MRMVIRFGNNKGMILILAVFLIAALSLIGVASTRDVIIDTAVSSNHLSSVQSFYIAEAGLEKGKLEAARRLRDLDWYSFTPLLDGTSSSALETPFGASMPFGQGVFWVTVSNDPGEAGSRIDKNRSITIRSTGQLGSSRSTVETTIQMLTPPKLPGAVSIFRDADLMPDGGVFEISGHDHTTRYQAGNPDGLSSALPGISLCETSASRLSPSTVRSTVNRTGEVNGSTDINQSDELVSATIQDYLTSLKPMATDSVSCSDFNITYVEKDFAVNCPSGKGILVVNGNLDFAENASWHGLVVVRGGNTPSERVQ